MSNTGKFPIAICYGDGIGPEIMKATVKVLDAAGANLEYNKVVMGEPVYLSGNTSGITEDSWAALKKHRVFLKAPITTPQGGGFKSINVTIRKAFKQYVNLRPCVAYSPFVKTHLPNFDVVIVRENEEDLYAGIEYQQTPSIFHSIKLLSLQGTRRIIEYAFEYAVKNNRKKVTCMTKDNIMKISDGMFHRVFKEVSAKYPQIMAEHYIIDIGTARLANRPFDFDVVVTLNLYGDVISDVVAEISGSVGLAGSANIGMKYAMFEAIHGSAPTLAGQNVANPSGLLNGAIMMLKHIGKGSVASMIQNAWLATLEEGVITHDLAKDHEFAKGKKVVGTAEFADEVIKNFGKTPSVLHAAPKYEDFVFDEKGGTDYDEESSETYFPKDERVLVGVDAFAYMPGKNKEVGKVIEKAKTAKLGLKMISSRGLTVYPNVEMTYANDQWRCRFMSDEGKAISSQDIIDLLANFASQGVEIIKTENLYMYKENIDGKTVMKPGFSLGQAE